MGEEQQKKGASENGAMKKKLGVLQTADVQNRKKMGKERKATRDSQRQGTNGSFLIAEER